MDIDGFIEEFEQLLSVHQGGVDGAVDGSKHVQRFIKLHQVCNEDDEVAGSAVSTGYTQGNDDRSNEKTERLTRSQAVEAVRFGI